MEGASSKVLQSAQVAVPVRPDSLVELERLLNLYVKEKDPNNMVLLEAVKSGREDTLLRDREWGHPGDFVGHYLIMHIYSHRELEARDQRLLHYLGKHYASVPIIEAHYLPRGFSQFQLESVDLSATSDSDSSLMVESMLAADPPLESAPAANLSEDVQSAPVAQQREHLPSLEAGLGSLFVSLTLFFYAMHFLKKSQMTA